MTFNFLAKNTKAYDVREERYYSLERLPNEKIDDLVIEVLFREVTQDIQDKIECEEIIPESFVKKILNLFSKYDYLQDIIIKKGLDLIVSQTEGADKALFKAAQMKYREMSYYN